MTAPTRETALPIFTHAVCIADATPAGDAARRQARALTAGGGSVMSLATPRRACRAPHSILRQADGADLIVLGAGATPDALVAATAVPLLLSRWLPVDEDIAERILVAVDQDADPSPAAAIAGSLAAAGNGTVAVAPAPMRDENLRRSANVTRRIVLETTGSWPGVLGPEATRAAEIASAVQQFDASLLVLPLGGTRGSRRQAIEALQRVVCPVLVVPS